jgi:Cu2+-exporting ATPase
MTPLVTQPTDHTAPSDASLANHSKVPKTSATVVLDVAGMMCAGCVSAVEKKLTQCDGVISARVNLVTEVAAIDCTPQANPQAIAQALSAAGYPSQLRAAHSQSAIAAETSWLVRKEQAQKAQVSQLAVASALLILSTIGHLQHVSWPALDLPVLSSLLSSPLSSLLSSLWFHGTLATLTLLFPARAILIDGFKGIRRAAPNMNTLVSLGALSAYLTSLVALLIPKLGWECFFDEPVMLLSFILLGRTLEQRARFRAASSLRSLIALQPTLARLVAAPEVSAPADTAGVQIPANQVKVGDWLRVLPGEKVPVDGQIAVGHTTVDESMLTGESMPASKQPGDEVIAGTLNQSGAITLQVSRIGPETTLSQMISLVETAQTRKAPIQGLADAISGYFAYGVLACAALTFGFWYFIGFALWPEVITAASGHLHSAHLHSAHLHSTHLHAGHMANTHSSGISASALRLLVSLKLAIAVVVVACPCALGLATPTAILVGSGLGAEQGLLIRGGDILEKASQLNRIVFDKTGTLTTGEPQVTDCIALTSELSADQLLQIAATVESGTRHPLGIAIARAAAQKNLDNLVADDFQTQPGFGVAAKVAFDSHQIEQVYLGNLAWMEKNGCGVDTLSGDRANQLAQIGKTAVFVAQDRQLIGLIGVADQLRPEAVETIKQLQARGFAVQILSGDTLAAAIATAQQLGLSAEQVQAQMSPSDKVAAIAALQAKGDRVGLVGDGINDAPALAQADIGIALNSGTPVAMETADIVLMGDTLTAVLAALQLSQATFNKIRQNLLWAFAYNSVCIPLAAGAFLPGFGLLLNPGFAGGLMALSSITVVLNSLLLRLQQPSKHGYSEVSVL